MQYCDLPNANTFWHVIYQMWGGYIAVGFKGSEFCLIRDSPDQHAKLKVIRSFIFVPACRLRRVAGQQPQDLKYIMINSNPK